MPPPYRTKPPPGIGVNWGHRFARAGDLAQRWLFNERGSRPVSLIGNVVARPQSSEARTLASNEDNGSMRFGVSGSDGYLNAGDDSSTKDLALGAMTIIARIKTTGFTVGGIAERSDGNTVNQGWIFGVSNTSLGCKVVHSTTDLQIVAANVLTASAWQWVALTLDGTDVAANAGNAFYVNGAPVTVTTQTNGAGTKGSDASRSLLIGFNSFVYAVSAGNAAAFNGSISDIAFYRHCFTPEEIRDYVAAPYAMLGNPLRRGWALGAVAVPGVTAALIGSQSAGAAGNLVAAGDVSRALTGTPGTASAGTMATARAVPLVGSAVASATGGLGVPVASLLTQHGATVVQVRSPAMKITAHGATIVRISDPCAAGVTYENPCAIRNPIFWIAIVDENGNVLKAGMKPLRDIQSYYGGYGAPRLLSIDGVRRVATDWLTRGWQAQSATVTLADTDHAVRGLTRGDLGGCQFYAYLVDDASRASHRFQRLLFQGPVLTDELPDDATTSVTANDVIGVDYALLSEDKLVPQRTIDEDFPNRPSENAGFGVPIAIGDTKDPDAFGAVKAFDVGDVTLNSLTKRAFMVCCGAVHELTVYQGDAEIMDGDANAWWPGSSNWTDLMPDGELYAEVNDNWYTLVMLDGWRDAAVDAGARLDKGEWAASVAKVVGDAVSPATNMVDGQGKFLYCKVAGMTGSSDALTVPAIGEELVDGSVTWVAVSETAAPIYFDVGGIGTKSNATGTQVIDGPLLAKYVLINFLIQSWKRGNWLPSPRFETFPGNGNFVCRVDTLSFDVASEVGTWYLDGGLKGGGIIGAGGKREQVRKVWADLLTSFNLMAAQSQYQQIKVAMLDRRRANFVAGVKTIDDRRDILASPGFSVAPKREWLCNDLALSWKQNYRDDGRGDWNGFTVKGNAPSKLHYGEITKSMQLPYARDNDTANVVGQQALDFRAESRGVATWSQSLCGLRRDVLDSVPITATWGRGQTGWRDRACWVLSQSMDSRNSGCSVTMTAVDVQDLVSQDERLRVHCPPSQVLTSSDGDPVIATFVDPTVTGGRAPITGSYDHPSGSSFLVGTTVVTWTAVSADGQFATCFLTITVSSTAGTFTLVVGDGSGDGPHPAGARVSIVADPPAAGKRFSNWGGPDAAAIDDALMAATALTMPSADAEVDAEYVDIAAPSGQLLLEWDANPSDEGVLGYVIGWGVVSGGAYSSRDVGNTLTYLLTGLVPGMTYYLVIWAYNAVGYSGYSTEISDVADPTP